MIMRKMWQTIERMKEHKIMQMKMMMKIIQKIKTNITNHQTQEKQSLLWIINYMSDANDIETAKK